MNILIGLLGKLESVRLTTGKSASIQSLI